jgi:proteic killer suppression protein
MDIDQGFYDRETEQLFTTGRSRRFGDLSGRAFQKLRMLDAAAQLRDLATLPGNRLETLAGNRKGQYSIRINDQFRICFDGATETLIVWRSRLITEEEN